MAITISTSDVQRTEVLKERSRHFFVDTPNVGGDSAITVFRQRYVTSPQNVVLSVDNADWRENPIQVMASEFATLCPDDVAMIAAVPAALDRLCARKRAKNALIAVGLVANSTRILEIADTPTNDVISEEQDSEWRGEDAGETVPTITTAPSNQSAAAGFAATFVVVASAPVADEVRSYAWQRSDDAGTTWVPIGGATAASYETGVLDSEDNGARFRCVVTNRVGTVTSASATLTVT